MEGMTLTELIAKTNEGLNFLCLPTPAKVLQVGIGNEDYTLGFVIDKGYIETEDLELMTLILNALGSFENIKLVGSVERIVYKDKGLTHYRQRIFFHKIDEVVKVCGDFGLYIFIPDECQLKVHHILGIKQKDMLSLDRYAHKNDLTIDEWLNLTFLYQLYLYFEEKYAGVLTTNTLRCCEHYLQSIRKEEMIPQLTDLDIMYTYLYNAPYFITEYKFISTGEGYQDLYYWNKNDNILDPSSLSGYTRKSAKTSFKDIFEETQVFKQEGQ